MSDTGSPASLDVAFVLHPLTTRAAGLLEGARGLGRALQERGDRVIAYGGGDPGDGASDDWFPAHARVLRTVGPPSFGFSPSLASELALEGHHLIHTHGLWTYGSAATTSWHRSTRRPYLVHPHGMLSSVALARSAGRKRLAMRLYQRRHLEQAACIRALSDGEADDVARLRLGVPVCVVPNGVEPPTPGEMFHAPWERTRVRKRILLTIGRLHPIKNLLELVEAWSRVGPASRDWTLAIAGWGEDGYDELVRRKARDLGAPDAVAFLGPVFGADRSGAHAHADAFVLPSLSEGLPIAVLEAWAHGKPVVMTRESNLPEGFAAGAAIRIGTAAVDMVDGLRRMVSFGDDDRGEMGERGRMLVRERFSWGPIAEEMRSVQRWIIEGGPAPETVRQKR